MEKILSLELCLVTERCIRAYMRSPLFCTPENLTNNLLEQLSLKTATAHLFYNKNGEHSTSLLIYVDHSSAESSSRMARTRRIRVYSMRAHTRQVRIVGRDGWWRGKMRT